jgi:high-affinity nickel permease
LRNDRSRPELCVLPVSWLLRRDATDADHVVAIATIVSRERSVAGSALIGAAWGVGHTITVMAVGVAIIEFALVLRWRSRKLRLPLVLPLSL